jgi:hypothetical protein
MNLFDTDDATLRKVFELVEASFKIGFHQGYMAGQIDGQHGVINVDVEAAWETHKHQINTLQIADKRQ